MTVTIMLLMSVIVGTAGAINSAYPVKMVELGETIPYDQAYNLDPFNIVPEDTGFICRLDPSVNCISRNANDPDGSKFRYLGAQFDSHNPAHAGEYYAVPYSSPYVVGNTTLDVDRIQTEPGFKTMHLKLYTVLPESTPTPTPTPEQTTVPTTVPTTEPTINYEATIQAIESKVTEHETQIAEIRETLASQTVVPTEFATPEPTIQSMAAPVITPTPTPTPTIDYDARILELEKKAAEAEEQVRKQNDLIYQIMKFLGMAE